MIIFDGKESELVVDLPDLDELNRLSVTSTTTSDSDNDYVVLVTVPQASVSDM